MGTPRLLHSRGSFADDSLRWTTPTAIPALTGTNLDMARMAVNPRTSTVHVTYRTRADIPESPGQPAALASQVFYIRTLDEGLTWSTPLALSDSSAAAPRPLVGPDEELYVFWIDFGSMRVVGRHSDDHGVSFGPLFTVAPIAQNFFTSPPNWTPYSGRLYPFYPLASNYFAPDFPAVAVDTTSGPRRGTLYAIWPEAVEGTLGPVEGNAFDTDPNDTPAQATPLAIGQFFSGRAISSDIDRDGDTDWFAFDGLQGQTIVLKTNFSLSPPPNDNFVNTNLISLFIEESPGVYKQITQANSLEFDLTVPPMVFTLPRTGRYYLRAPGAQGRSSANYSGSLRLLEPSPISVARDHRDLVLTSSSDGGQTWSPKVRVNGSPPGFDDCLPEIHVDDLGRVHVAWYGRAHDPNGRLADTYWTFSTDGGQSFVPDRRISEVSSDWEPKSTQVDVGEHLDLTSENGRLHLFWTDLRDGTSQIYTSYVTDIPVSIAIPRFTAEVAGTLVRLGWSVLDGSGLVGFHLERAEAEAGAWLALAGSERPYGGEREFVFDDAGVTPGTAYRYRLAVRHADGRVSYEGPLRVETPTPAGRLAFARFGPNPCRGDLAFTLVAPRATRGVIEVLDVAGQRVALLGEGNWRAGPTAWRWDGRDRSGRRAPPGIYRLRARSEAGDDVVRSVVVLR